MSKFLPNMENRVPGGVKREVRLIGICSREWTMGMDYLIPKHERGQGSGRWEMEME